MIPPEFAKVNHIASFCGGGNLLLFTNAEVLGMIVDNLDFGKSSEVPGNNYKTRI